MQLLLAKCPWKEHKSDSGRPYFYNSDTKESIWVIPKELEEAKERIANEKLDEIKYVLLVGEGVGGQKEGVVKCGLLFRTWPCWEGVVEGGAKTSQTKSG